MFKRKDDSYFEEGNGYRINDVPSDVNYNTCNVRYTLNNDFSKNPRAQFRDSTNRHSMKPHTDVNASNNQQHKHSGAAESKPMSSQGAQRSSNAQRPNASGQRPGTQRAEMGGTRTTDGMQRPVSTSPSRPQAKKASPISFSILVIVFIIAMIVAIEGASPAPIIIILIIVSSIISSNKKNRKR